MSNLNQATLDVFAKSRLYFRSFVSKPQPADLFERQSWTMGGVHLMLTEGLMSVYKQAQSISKADERDFTLYALAAVGSIHHHHVTEETQYLPRLAPEFNTPIVDEHALFADKLHELEHYLLDVVGLDENPIQSKSMVTGKPRQAYDGAKIVAYLDSFVEPLFTHLQQELTYLAADNLHAMGLPLCKLQDWEVYEMEMIKGFDPYTQVVFIVNHLPKDSPFPPLPWFVRNILVPYVFYGKHRNLWRFAPKQESLN